MKFIDNHETVKAVLYIVHNITLCCCHYYYYKLLLLLLLFLVYYFPRHIINYFNLFFISILFTMSIFIKHRKQESVFDKHKCPRKHKIMKQMFSVYAYFSRIQRCLNKNKTVKTIVHIMLSYEVEMILTVLETVTLNWCEFSILF